MAAPLSQSEKQGLCWTIVINFWLTAGLNWLKTLAGWWLVAAFQFYMPSSNLEGWITRTLMPILINYIMFLLIESWNLKNMIRFVHKILRSDLVCHSVSWHFWVIRWSYVCIEDLAITLVWFLKPQKLSSSLWVAFKAVLTLFDAMSLIQFIPV